MASICTYYGWLGILLALGELVPFGEGSEFWKYPCPDRSRRGHMGGRGQIAARVTHHISETEEAARLVTEATRNYRERELPSVRGHHFLQSGDVDITAFCYTYTAVVNQPQADLGTSVVQALQESYRHLTHSAHFIQELVNHDQDGHFTALKTAFKDRHLLCDLHRIIEAVNTQLLGHDGHTSNRKWSAFINQIDDDVTRRCFRLGRDIGRDRRNTFQFLTYLSTHLNSAISDFQMLARTLNRV